MPGPAQGQSDGTAFARAATDEVALAALAAGLLEAGGRALLLGPPGTGKSTLARRLAAALAEQGQAPVCIGADPGSPEFGVPGAVCLARWRDGRWQSEALEALCSLDAGRFRLPLVACVRRLTPRPPAAPVLVDGPGVVRGVAGAELLAALTEAAAIDAVVMLQRPGRAPLLAGELHALGLPVLRVEAAAGACRPGKSARARLRTGLWNAHLEGAESHALDLPSTPVLGTPPPRLARAQWRGRQCALLRADGRTAAIGEVQDIDESRVQLRCHVRPRPGQALLVRDARRETNGLLGTAGPDAVDAVRYVAPADVLASAHTPTGPRPVVRAGSVTAAMVNGVLGDPLLHVRLHHRRRSLLFDLGEAGRLPAKIAHQVSDLLLSHAHIDHIAGFLWLMRSRIGDFPALRVFGPPGIARNLGGLLDGILWDRIGSRGPRFEVHEFDGDRLSRFGLRGGGDTRPLGEKAVVDGVVLAEPEFCIRATPLDHGHGTRVLGFALECSRTLKVRRERLEACGLAPGPWLTRLKMLIAANARAEPVELPDGRRPSAGALAEGLLIESPGIKLAYATDLADTAANRASLARLSSGAHTFFCEASFRLSDEPQARRTGHLTTRACAEIARQADVQRLVPFHFSRRYENDLAAVYDEIRASFPRTITPMLRDVPD